MNQDYRTSDARIIKAVPKTAENPYGIIDVDSVTVGTPAIIALGGEFTYTQQAANHYISQIRQILTKHHIDGADIYSVYYNFGSRYADLERQEIFRAASRKIKEAEHPNAREFRRNKIAQMQENEPNPIYVQKLYNMIIKPMIFNENGVVRPIAEIAENTNKLRMYAYSHGAAVIYAMGKIATTEMKQSGIAPSDAKKLLKNIVVIQFGPVAPLEHPVFTTLSFASGSDTMSDGHNNFSEYMYENAENLYPGYFSQLGTHVFIAGKINERYDKEHDDSGVVSDDGLTEDGQVLFSLERNAIVNVMRATVQNRPTPSVQEMVSGHGVDFEELKHNGNVFYDRMVKRLRAQKNQKQIPEPDYQK